MRIKVKNIQDKIVHTLSQQYFKNILLVGGITVFAKGIGFFKESVIASKFGLSELLDTFFIAILIPSFINSVFIDSLKNIFIPNYIIELNTTKNRKSFQSTVVAIMLFIVIVLILFNFIFANFILELIFPNHTDVFYNLIKSQLFIVLPCLVFWGFSSIFKGLLEIDNKYFITSITDILTPISILLCIYLLSNVFHENVLAYGTLIGSMASFVVVLFYAWKHDLIHLGKFELNDNIREMIRQFPPKIISGFLSGLNNFIDQFFAAQLIIGSISALNYGIKIPSFILGISMVALGNVLLPHFSRMIMDNPKNGFQHLFKMLKFIFVAGVTIVSLIIFFSDDIIRILFERNEFTQEDTGVVSNIQIIFLIYVPFYLCGHILVKFLTSINKNKFMAWASFVKLVANIILNIILIKKYGIYGLAISTTIIFTVNSLIYLIYTLHQYKLIAGRNETS
ncbi:murein biosynthesis integral membrane protein MurJ [Flagellimonas sp. S3867]|uniref:murein biosynthesis integral membrane protein MurJ n=1 Tax=Flagellimonas sp. S3867 TaxID=2768063 RepID=UPI001686AE3C|nr:lipid II flippase MurJ [Flagellimonas sp. S3867]